MVCSAGFSLQNKMAVCPINELYWRHTCGCSWPNDWSTAWKYVLVYAPKQLDVQENSRSRCYRTHTVAPAFLHSTLKTCTRYDAMFCYKGICFSLSIFISKCTPCLYCCIKFTIPNSEHGKEPQIPPILNNCPNLNPSAPNFFFKNGRVVIWQKRHLSTSSCSRVTFNILNHTSTPPPPQKIPTRNVLFGDFTTKIRFVIPYIGYI